MFLRQTINSYINLYIDIKTLNFQVSSLQQVCAAQLGDGMLYPLNRFIEADLAGNFLNSFLKSEEKKLQYLLLY